MFKEEGRCLPPVLWTTPAPQSLLWRQCQQICWCSSRRMAGALVNAAITQPGAIHGGSGGVSADGSRGAITTINVNDIINYNYNICCLLLFIFITIREKTLLPVSHCRHPFDVTRGITGWNSGCCGSPYGHPSFSLAGPNNAIESREYQE